MVKRVRIRASIGAKIFGAFIAMSAIIGVIGAYGYSTLSAAGDIVAETYNGPLMGINFARSASLTFDRMDKEILRRVLATPEQKAEIDTRIDGLAEDFYADLKVAEERALAPDERAVILEIRRLVGDWQTVARDLPQQDIQPLSERIIDRFDVLIELTADHSFVARRKAVTAVDAYKVASITVVVSATLLAALIALVLARRISRPLASAAKIADCIADGQFETPIPEGDSDETGILLRSMKVMQENIRVMVEREQAQRLSAQNRLVDAVERSHDAVVLVDAHGRIALANQQLAKFFPAIASKLTDNADFATVFAEAGHGLGIGLAAPSADGEPVTACLPTEGEFLLADGRWIHLSRSDTQDGGFFLILSDFTEIKAREERFREASEAAQAASAAKSNFLANMSHELRTPLNAVIGFSEILVGQLFGPLGSARYIEYSSHILESGRHLLDVINSVLDLAKSQAGKLQLAIELVDLGEIVEHCAEMLGDQFRRANIDFLVRREDSPAPIEGDRAKLRQIVLNLLSNAHKFTEAGGHVELRTETAEDGRPAIIVADTGIGMSPEEIPLALAAFGQVDSRLSRRYEGTGLGLPLTKVLVELHGGELLIASTPGKGTVVTVLLGQSSRPALAAPGLSSAA